MAFSTANWHWKNKNVTPWAKGWFERELVAIAVDGDAPDTRVSIARVIECDGDVELGRRKSKLITIFDCKLVLEWSGTGADGAEATGRLTIPEVSHDIILDQLSDFVWNFTQTSGPAELLALARSRLPAALEAVLARFPAALIETHGREMIVGDDPSRGGTPVPEAQTVPSVKQESAVKQKTKEDVVNTGVVEVEATFAASAADLFSILTDEKRIPAWSRAAAKSDPQPGAEYVLFGGGVKGKYVAVSAPKEIKQTWTLSSPSWPAGHEATLTTRLAQATDSTTVTFTLEGVPTGMEDELRRNLEGY
ncbi:activator of Hsp90 ATPase [Vararia minispora EC-137]|uniref:Activator of Hsp90 ATPase n=1 Tax=Vararia minispora EC-137 TaxID=1314806 RepID=A0ACB8QR68_9AGAM|nr:activator of Hsp90 ATPase [Vararia minispora EC-137]